MPRFAQAVRHNIQQYGWYNNFVSASTSENPRINQLVNFCHSIGLAEQNMPELIISGNMAPMEAHRIMTNVINRWRRDGIRLGRHTGIFSGNMNAELPVELIEVDLSYRYVREYFVPCLMKHYQDRAIPPRLVQIRWPDKSGRLPSETGFAMLDQTDILPPLTATMEA